MKRAFVVLDKKWQEKMKRGEAQYCARCGNERRYTRRYEIPCISGKRHIWKWSL